MIDARDQRVHDDIAKYGCHVITVVDPENILPTFSYSVGIQASCGGCEVIVLGLSVEMGHFIVNEFNILAKRGESFERGKLYTGFLVGFSVYVEPVKRKHAREYMRFCNWYYGNKPYKAVQIIYPTTSGIWPWEKAATEWFQQNQPMLGRIRPDAK